LAGGFGNDLALGSELREELGLGADEVVRVLHAAPTTMLLERACSASPVAIPWDRDLVLSADVRSFPLADILSMIHAAGKSGFVYFRHEEHEKSIHMHRGEVVFASSNQIIDRIGECMLRSGSITLQQLRDAERSFSPPGRFGKVLVQRGVLTPRQLWNGVKSQVEDIVRSLFAYTAGTVHFWDGDVPPDNVVRLSLPTQRLIAEGLARRDDLLKLLALVEDPRVVLRRTDEQTQDLAANERALRDALGSGRTFTSACRAVGLDPLSGARAVQLLSLVGAITIDRGGDADEACAEGRRARTPEDDVRALVQGYVKVLGELVAPIVAIDGTEVVGRRVGSVVEDAAQRHPALLRDIRIGPGGLLDPDEVAHRAVRLPGERARTVAAALGELVAYLEFELRNHPRIDEPELYLSAVEDLRAQLEL